MICPLCQRDMSDELMQKHHLVTRRTDKKATELICRECHRTLHGLFGNKEIRNPKLELDTLDGILANAEFRKALDYIRKVHPGSSMQMRESNKRGHRR